MKNVCCIFSSSAPLRESRRMQFDTGPDERKNEIIKNIDSHMNGDAIVRKCCFPFNRLRYNWYILNSTSNRIQLVTNEYRSWIESSIRVTRWGFEAYNSMQFVFYSNGGLRFRCDFHTQSIAQEVPLVASIDECERNFMHRFPLKKNQNLPDFIHIKHIKKK